MRIGIPREIKNNEFRVAMTPAGVAELTQRGHQVYVETLAGAGAGLADEDYIAAGAEITSDADLLFEQAQLIVKVKEPQAIERARLKPHHTLFTYLHLAADKPQTDDLLHSGATCIAYETVTNDSGQLPLLAPMSEVAGRMAIQAGASTLEKSKGGRGMLLGGVPGVLPANVVILGAGVVGRNAVQIAVGMGANVTVLDRNLTTLAQLDGTYQGRVNTLFSTHDALAQLLPQTDLLIGGVLIPGAAAPKLVTREMLDLMPEGAVIVDVAIDQGGCVETARPTTHADPTYLVDGVVHYCVANMPGAVARTSTFALSNATLPYVLQLAELGPEHAMRSNQHLLNGLNIRAGKLCCQAVADAFDYPAVEPASLL